MNRTRGLLLALSVAGVVGFHASPANAQSSGAGTPETTALAGLDWQNAHVFVGVRLWATQWDVPFASFTPTGEGTQVDIVRSLSNTKIVPMPTVGVAAGKWLLAATLAPTTSYDCRCALGSVDRREFDINLGYEVLPRLYLSMGYKEAKQDKFVPDTPSEVKIKALLLGANASAPLTDTVTLYGNAAYGFARYRSEATDPEGRSDYDGEYEIGEVGVSWRFGEMLGPTWRNTSVALGYRFQSFVAKDATVSAVIGTTGTTTSATRGDFRSNTSGPVVTLIAFF
jgi:hypothetical protein